MLPGLHWAGGLDTASQLSNAGIERVIVTAESIVAWRDLGFSPESDAGLVDYTEVGPPTVRMERSIAAATSVPWVEANGWHFLRGVEFARYRDMPSGLAALAVAEAFSYRRRHTFIRNSVAIPSPQHANWTRRGYGRRIGSRMLLSSFGNH